MKLQDKINAAVAGGQAAYDELRAAGMSHAEITVLTMTMDGVLPEDMPHPHDSGA